MVRTEFKSRLYWGKWQMLENKNKKDFNVEIFIRMRRNLIYTVGMVLLSLGMIFFAVIPQFQQAWELRNEVEAEKPKLEKLKQKLAALGDIRFSPEFAQVDLVNQALPSKKPLLDLMVSLNNISVTSGAIIESFELSPGMIASDASAVQPGLKNVRNQGGVDTLDVGMSVIGTDESVQMFITELEKIAPFTTITQMSLNSLLTSDGQASVGQGNNRKAELSTSTFFFTKPIAAAVEAPLPVIDTPDQVILNALAKLVPSELPEQTSISGGGLEDLFGVDPLLFE